MEDFNTRPNIELQTYRLSFHGSAGTLFGIHIVNVFLALVTFGVYSFWGRTRVRKYLFSQTAFSEDRFVYHGTGGEILKGFLKVFFAFGIPLMLIGFIQEIPSIDERVRAIVGFAGIILTLILIPMAIVGAWRYRLSRTSWRAIRFSFRGKTSGMVKLYLVGTLLMVLAAGFYYPFFIVRRHRYLISKSYFGNSRFHFDGRDGGLFGSYVFALLMSIVAAILAVIVAVGISFLSLASGLSWESPIALDLFGLLWAPAVSLATFWVLFTARKQAYLWNHTTLASARFCFNVTTKAFFFLKCGNFLLLILTLGFGRPWAMVRNARFLCRHLTLEGKLDLAAIEQEARSASATGEGLAGLFDVEADFGLG